MTDIFISYRRDEQRECVRIADKLRALQYNVWFDAKLSAGESFTGEIERAVKRAKAVLVLWSPSSVNSRWVRNEADMGRERNVLVAVQIKPCDMPIEFRDIHFDPLFDPDFADDDPQWLRVLERIGQLTDRPGVASYSKALGGVRRQLNGWAEQNPTDVLSSYARTLSRELNAQTPAPPPKRGGAGAVLGGLAVAAAAGALGFLGANFLPSPVRAAPSAQTTAGELVGVWNEVGLGDCGVNALHISLSAEGLDLRVGDASETQAIRAVEDGWLATASGVRYRRDGANLVSQLSAGASEAVYTPCS